MRELRLHLDDHFGGRPRDQGCVAQELNGIAETLLGMEKDGLAEQWKFSEPQRPAESARLRISHSRPPFVFREAAPKIARGEQAQRFVVVRVRVFLADRERARAARERLRMTVERVKRRGAVVPRLRM